MKSTVSDIFELPGYEVQQLSKSPGESSTPTQGIPNPLECRLHRFSDRDLPLI